MGYLFLVFLAGMYSCTSTRDKSFDPTGTYLLGDRPMDVSDSGDGYNGRIQILRLADDKVVLTVEINKGAPSYNSGSIVDTLTYTENNVTYTDPEHYPGCKITFEFDHEGVNVRQHRVQSDYGCGFGNGVEAHGYFKKFSGKIPILQISGIR
jgi:hypothetical protein